jgi:hypothetical protein
MWPGHDVMNNHTLHAGFLKMEVIRSSEKQVPTRTTWRYIPGDGNIQTIYSLPLVTFS